MPEIPHFLADTWWFGLSRRLKDSDFRKLALLRKNQGFNAIQLLVGIPPEVGPENPNAASEFGSAWDLQKKFNEDYLKVARKKIKLLNSLGFLVIIYGAWGHQIEWLGKEKMMEWWDEIVGWTNDLSVFYCICGESSLWIGEEDNLLPDKSTDDLHDPLFLNAKKTRLKRFLKKIKSVFNTQANGIQKRKKLWSEILKHLYEKTGRPIIIHPVPGLVSTDCVFNSDLLAAVTMQTGHDSETKKSLWQLPLKYSEKNLFINLEPWYEGIRDKFEVEDQLFAYWASMMAGSHAYCYGAQGIWNVGDGRFLTHWGKQTFDQAVSLSTPILLGKSHKFFTDLGFFNYKKLSVKHMGGVLVIIRKNGIGKQAEYISEISGIKPSFIGKVFLPLKGGIVKSLPVSGPVVIFS